VPAAKSPLRRPPVLPIVAVLIAIVLEFVVSNNTYELYVATQVGIDILITIGFNIIFGFAGITFLGQSALVAIAGYATALLTVDQHWDFWAASGAALIITIICGLVIALPSLRISAWYFALITLGLDQLVQDLLLQFHFTGGQLGIIGVPMPSIGGYVFNSTDVYFLVLALIIVAALFACSIARSRFGRGMLAAKQGSTTATVNGGSPLALKLIAFSFAAATCSVAGSVLAAINVVVTPDQFTVNFSIFFVVALIIGGSGRLWGPIIGCLVFFAVPDFLHAIDKYQLLVYGVFLLLFMRFMPHGLMGFVDWCGNRVRRSPGWNTLMTRLRLAHAGVTARVPRTRGGTDAVKTVEAVSGPVDPRAETPNSINGAALKMINVDMHFGGVAALRDLNIDVLPGSIHAVVGPNGSGKTTALNVISGFIRPQGGQVRFDGTVTTGISPRRIARLGVARTFQTPRLLPGVSVVDNVLLGAFGRERASAAEVLLHVGRARKERRRLVPEAEELCAFVGIEALAYSAAGTITHGHRRLVDVARALMGKPRLLLLDEPAGGLSKEEIEHFLLVMRRIRATGTTVLLIDHHIDMVCRIADEITVLEAGSVLATGHADSVLKRADVITAYMGRSGRVPQDLEGQ
jgi:ABC-type branched-subunit amino acid transport system ATPase component/ABC-type branched-subunit amino acid transport system permease subunit